MQNALPYVLTFESSIIQGPYGWLIHQVSNNEKGEDPFFLVV